MKSISCLLFLVFQIFLFSNNVSAQLLDSTALANAVEYKSLKEALVNPSKVYKLNLHKQRLTKFPADILKFVNLNVLNLSNNKITKFPAELSQLAYLQNLNMAKNELSAIPPEISQLKNLQILTLNRNDIQSLPSEMGTMYNLKYLDIWGTEINELPYEISKLKHTLLKLDMRVIYMKRGEQEEILKWFPLTEVLFSRPCNCN